jgi:hypothetical protein
MSCITSARVTIGSLFKSKFARAAFAVALPHIMSDDLARFASQLKPLYQTLSGVAQFDTLEGQLTLRLLGDGKGHIALEGEVRDQPGRGNHLKFHLEFDQSQLAQSIKDLDAILSACESRAI